MNALTRNSVLALLTTLTVTSLVAPVAEASKPKALLIAPGEPNGGFTLPKFGFSSFNINGYGERITNVNWHGRAAKLGLEPGDVILSLNGYPLNYHGSWSDALYEAVANGGFVRLKIRDVRTGSIAFRETFVGGGYGPVTPKYNVGYPVGPVTSHSVHHPHDGHYGNGGVNLKKIAKLIDKLDD